MFKLKPEKNIICPLRIPSSGFIFIGSASNTHL